MVKQVDPEPPLFYYSLVSRDSTPPIIQPGPSTISQDTSNDDNISTVDKITNTQQIKFQSNILSPISCIKTVIQKIKKGTKLTLELTSSLYKNEIEAKENINERQKPVLDREKVKTKKK
ncbi:hypothetical protein PV326_011635 [Microctonus aethiopoides]|nr:hypothetical protein PV326_011635 [Microctonus aethiopoides]